MAFAAAEQIDVHGVGKDNFPYVFGFEGNVAGVAPVTVAFDAEGYSAVVAVSAGIAFLHRCHGGVVAIVFFLKYMRVALCATSAVNPVIVNDFTDGLGLYVNFGH
jgi:hypothetical protein